MSSISNILNESIFGKDNFCFLCFKVFDEGSIQFQTDDEVILEDVIDLHLFELLNYIFKKNIQEGLGTVYKICLSCRKTAINCYKFMKMCEENSKLLNDSVQSIIGSLQNTIDDVDSYGSLFLIVHTKDYTTQQYYDDKHYNDKTVASIRLQSILNINKKSESQNIENSYLYEDLDQRNDHSLLRKRIINDISKILTSELIYKGKNASQFQCKNCLKPFRAEKILRKHYFKTHYPRKYKCSKCTQSFISEVILKEHYLEYHDNKICRQCGKQFKNKYNLAKHELNHNIHVMCQGCGRVYSSMATYNNHVQHNICRQKSRKNSDEATFYCDYCNKKFCHKPYLAKHIKFEHENAEGFKCTYCNKTFYTPSNLASHIVKHTQEKNHQCMICNKMFGSKMALLYHTRLHTGETPYKCDFCEKSFLSSSRRLDHMRRYHLEPSLECEICHCKFKTSGSLLKHKKRHFNPNSRLDKLFIT